MMRALPEINLLCPFYDADVIRFALKLPPDLIFRDGQTKYFLRWLFKGWHRTHEGEIRRRSLLCATRIIPSAREYVRVSPTLRRLYLRSLGRNLLKAGGLYNELARVAALVTWMGSHEVMIPERE